jgi:protein involved in polysaccharide export with SLBB domain
MNKLYTIIFILICSFLIKGCSQILEPVLFDKRQSKNISLQQEEFQVDIKALTFNSAKKANTSPYPRKLMREGIGNQANVFKETDLLITKIPQKNTNSEYIIGIGDELIFTQIKEFFSSVPQWPEKPVRDSYLLGAGDLLTFYRLNSAIEPNLLISESGRITPPNPPEETILKTSSVIGSDGNILLLGLGNIKASSRTLEDIRSEIRNILIRNGDSPNFQLEITGFNSQKAFVTVNTGTNKVLEISNLDISLKEIALESGISESFENFALIILTRDQKEYRFTAKQLFSLSAPEIYIQDGDQIEFEILKKHTIQTTSVVGTKGNILLSDIGSFKALGKTLQELQSEVSRNLSDTGLVPNFQLELSKFVSKKAFLILKNKKSEVITLTNDSITLRELILENDRITISHEGLLIFTLKRDGRTFSMTGEQILDPNSNDIWIQEGDQIEVENLVYKPGQVYAISGSKSATIIPIKPSVRESLADVLFVSDGPLNNELLERSEVYLLRGQKPAVAYHLDTQDVSRLLVAAQTELRPNDIIFVADRPIISFARTLSEINPLRILLRDIGNGNIP